MLANDRECSMKVVDQKIDRSQMFGWSWSKQESEPFRHTAIVQYFNQCPTFTINFRPKNGTKYCEAAFSECGSVVTIETVHDREYGVTYHDPLEEFPIKSGSAKKEARDVVVLILSYDPARYNLFINNCRDYVEGVINHMSKHRREVKIDHYRAKMNGVREGDAWRITGAAAASVVVLGTALAGVAKFVSWLKEDEEEEKKVSA